MSNGAINVYSDIGKLRKVMLHRPGTELENLMPEYLERLLFDDIPFLRVAQEEHDAFAEILRKNGTEVVYLVDLAAQSLINDEVKNQFIDEYLTEAGITTANKKAVLTDFFKSFETKAMICKMMAGVRKTEIKNYAKTNLIDFLEDNYPFLIDPMPNLYFTRDPWASVGSGVNIHRMHTVTRNRETIFAKYIFSYHPEYKDVPKWYDRDMKYSIEGGDVCVLNENTLAVGMSQRTRPEAIEELAHRLLGQDKISKILAINIPNCRAFMHLDTVFTMVDYNKFTIHPNITSEMNSFELSLDSDKKLKIVEQVGTIDEMLKRQLGLSDIELIKCGNGNIIDAAREQWNDGSNTLAIAPGSVVVYERNYVSNKLLEEYGINLNVIPSAELSRGRGGPRCMSMPLIREDLK